MKQQRSQIVIFTDGLSNVGLGQTDQKNFDKVRANEILQQSKNQYDQIANLACSLNLTINLISFSDEQIGSAIIRPICQKTNGILHQIKATETQKDAQYQVSLTELNELKEKLKKFNIKEIIATDLTIDIFCDYRFKMKSLQETYSTNTTTFQEGSRLKMKFGNLNDRFKEYMFSFEQKPDTIVKPTEFINFLIRVSYVHE